MRTAMCTVKMLSSCTVALVLAGDAHLSAQAPDFSGTWALDAARSQVAADAGFAGLIASGAPPRLHVTQPANGTLMVESEINEGHVRIYNPRARSTTPVFQGGSITMTSKWEGRRLLSEGTQESPSGASTTVKQVRESLALSADGRTLSVEIVAASGAAASTSTLLYTRTQDVGPCQTWTTPCKGRP